MTKRKNKPMFKDITGNYILESVFRDVHEYEVYFEFSNKDCIDRLSPNRLRVSFKLNGKKQELYFPDDGRMIELIIPITKGQNNPRTKAKLTKRYIHEFGDLVPKIRLSLKNQIAANNKVLGSSNRVILALNESAKKRRASAVRKARNILNKM